jgi:hypothetical protein
MNPFYRQGDKLSTCAKVRLPGRVWPSMELRHCGSPGQAWHNLLLGLPHAEEHGSIQGSLPAGDQALLKTPQPVSKSPTMRWLFISHPLQWQFTPVLLQSRFCAGRRE